MPLRSILQGMWCLSHVAARVEKVTGRGRLVHVPVLDAAAGWENGRRYLFVSPCATALFYRMDGKSDICSRICWPKVDKPRCFGLVLRPFEPVTEHYRTPIPSEVGYIKNTHPECCVPVVVYHSKECRTGAGSTRLGLAWAETRPFDFEWKHFEPARSRTRCFLHEENDKRGRLQRKSRAKSQSVSS
ncbi:unnamed protein product, partial [Hapterophycus canaliculatus]